MSKKNKRNNKRENVENVNVNVTAQMVAGIKIDRVDLSRIASACESMACLLLDHGDTLTDAREAVELHRISTKLTRILEATA